MPLRTARCFLFLLAPAFAAGCFLGKDLKDVLAEHRAPVEAKLANVKALREQARALPVVSSDAVHIAGGPAPVVAWGSGIAGVNASIAYLEDLDNLAELGNVPHRIAATGTINRCASVLTTHREPYDAAYPQSAPPTISSYRADEVLDLCEALRYLLVIRSIAFVEPSAPTTSTACSLFDAGTDDGGAADAGTCHRFDGGYLKAEVLVFDVETSSHLGGFGFVAENSAAIDVTDDGANVKAAIAGNFRRNIEEALKAAARKALPGLPTED
ncbi:MULTISPECIES: hypothetical protein [Polyangium]|uniref:Lipoprotein n=2 Tax=Polyangium TaxID=55 RepID=A0A4U1JFX1_9BACT|nr:MULTISPECIES: hypothetical protein [Polyangium]MDI1428981.1 hypothetical protein [Polyangium sorediatum]TKD10177.1 hypothetical protein E8A74_09170 [Polyangium fumosum]